MARLKRMKKAVLTSGRLHQDFIKRGFRFKPAMLTLTYRPGVEWEAKHVSALVTHVRNWFKRHRCGGLRYVWVLELQKNGHPHYHIMFWLPKGRTLPKPDKQGWWPHGSTRVEWVKKAVGYLSKYVSKGFAGDGHKLTLPSGARIYGVGGLDAIQRDEKSWWMSPAWVREIWSIEDRPRAAIGGGWMALRTGDWRPSPYEVRIYGGSIHVAKREDVYVYLDDCIEWSIETDPLLREIIDTVEQIDGWWQMHTTDEGQRFSELNERRQYGGRRPEFDVQEEGAA